MEKKKILIIDDEGDICDMMKLNLESTGEFEVMTATTGEEGVEKAKKTKIDLVISDFYMPGMNGEEVLGAIKEIDSKIPVLLFSIYHDDESTLATSVKKKADGIINKPINHRQLYNAIKGALSKSA